MGRELSDVVLLSRARLDRILHLSLSDFEFPVMVDVDFGHIDPRLTIPLGVPFRMDAKAGELKLVDRNSFA